MNEKVVKEEKEVIKISVRELVEFILREGDIDNRRGRGASAEAMLAGAARLCELPIDILKLHQLQIVRGTRMAEQYSANPAAFALYSEEEYLDFIVRVIERIPPRIYLERFVNQSPAEYLIAPRWGSKNFEFAARLDKRLEEADTWQGKLYVNKTL